MKVEKKFRILLYSWLPDGTYQKIVWDLGVIRMFLGVKMIKI
jgi:hypothetical protein